MTGSNSRTDSSLVAKEFQAEGPFGLGRENVHNSATHGVLADGRDGLAGLVANAAQVLHQVVEIQLVTDFQFECERGVEGAFAESSQGCGHRSENHAHAAPRQAPKRHGPLLLNFRVRRTAFVG